MPLAGGMQMGLLCKRETRNVAICAKLKGCIYCLPTYICVCEASFFVCGNAFGDERGGENVFMG